MALTIFSFMLVNIEFSSLDNILSIDTVLNKRDVIMKISGDQIILAKEILDIFANKKIDEDWSFAEYTRQDTSKWTHNYHRYPAKFIPQLVEKLIDEYITTKSAHINDPFYGCGTTIVTAISRGFKASGTDINKVAHLITKVKSTPMESEYLKMKINKFLYTVRC